MTTSCSRAWHCRLAEAPALAAVLAATLAGAACDRDTPAPAPDAGPEPIVFPDRFRFGAATSAHQTEGGNENNDWHQFETLPEFEERTEEPSGRAAGSWDRYEVDAALAADLGLGVFRLSLEWSRIEPRRGAFDPQAIDHYRAVLEAVRDRGLRPSVTLHHFTSPIWVQDLRDADCAKGPSDDNLCGWSNPEVAGAFEAFAARVAAEYGALVDEWVTLNEPNVLVVAGYVLGQFPPARMALTVEQMQEHAVPALRTTLDAHARAYRAVHAADRADADGDGAPARVGLAISAMHWVPAHDTEEDEAATLRLAYLWNCFYPEAIARGAFDADLDGEMDEERPDWAGTLDFLGYQYYARIPVVHMEILRPIDALPCVPELARLLGEDGCPLPAPADVTQMGYEHYPAGISAIGREYHEAWPDLPLLITENGIATLEGRRRAQSVVRHLREVAGLIADGVPIEGYYHWSLIDNFEWAEGFRPRFGLYRVDFDTLERTATLGAEVYGAIARAGRIEPDALIEYGEGPLVPEPEPERP